MSDAAALEWLGRLLDLTDEGREAELTRLGTEDPDLHARLTRLWRAAGENSYLLAGPVAAGLGMVEAAAAGVAAGQTLAGYRLVRELGRGGMAVVWLAERADGSVKRQVALKLPLHATMSEVEGRRFAREKDVLASLAHSNIARLYDAGVTSSGQPFIVLEHVDGIPITKFCDQHRLAIPARLELFLSVLAAVEHAHKHLIVHRDLKPSNILVDARGQAKLLDFGIARLLADPSREDAVVELTQHGGLALTPLYAAPEQVRGESISTLTDVYVLGAVLHELLCGTVPHATEPQGRPALAQWVEAVSRDADVHVSRAPTNDEAARNRCLPGARRLKAFLSGDLDRIVRQAMRRVPADRYSSVERFADDIRRFLARKPIAARPVSIWYSARLFVRRNRAATLLAALGTILSATAGLVALEKQSESREYAARSVAVRDFMYDFVNDAEPSESQPDAPVPFLEMLDGAVVRARNDFRDRPQLQGELLSELGRMYSTLGESGKSAPILREAVTILERHAPPDDPGLNKTRAYLASELLDQNELEQARALATRSRDACTRVNTDCTKARAYALTVIAMIERKTGSPELALATKRLAVEEMIRAFGERDAMTVISMQGLAVMARNSGHLVEASTVMKRAVEIATHVTMRRGDRVALQRNMATMDLDLGNYAAARERLARAIPNIHSPEERALEWRMIANTWLGEGEPQAALDAADSALRLAEDSGTKAEALFARQARARALALLGRSTDALLEIQDVIAGLQELKYGEDSTEITRARRFHAEILLRAGRFADGLRELETLVARMSIAREPQHLEWGQTLDLEGCALRELNRLTEARAAHIAAKEHLQKQLAGDHPLLARNTLYQDAAADDHANFERRAEVVKRGFAETSIWRRLIEGRSNADCRQTGLKICPLIL